MRLVGPSLKEIAARYKGKKVSSEVAKRIIQGSEGRWGDMAHPSNAALDPADAALIARWILAGAH
jgi:cytochrome c